MLGRISNTFVKRTKPDLFITFEMHFDSEITVDKTSLNHLDDFVQNCIDEAKGAFSFEMTIPDPFPPNDNGLVQSSQEIRRLTGELTPAALHSCKVEGILFYYPFSEGVETRPYTRQGESDAIDSDPTFTIYWQDRLVPQSSVMKLPFFPKSVETFAKCKNKSISYNWMNRIKGFLFFDWNFRHISNNKLKIQIPDINEWLNHTNTVLTFNPTRVVANFLLFLQQCHKDFDREFLFDTRDIELENELNSNKINTEPLKSYFERFIVGDNKFIIKKNDFIKFKNPALLKGNYKVYGQVVGFEVLESLDKNDNKYYGNACICYKREPQSIFGSVISKYRPYVSSIEFDAYKLEKKDKNDLINKFAHDIQICLFETVGSQIINLFNNYEITANKKYYKIGIQLLNKKNTVVKKIPQSNQCYKVQVKYAGQVNYGTTNTVYIFDETQNKDIQVDSTETNNAILANSYYSFGNSDLSIPLIFQSEGTFPLEINVFDDISFGISTIIKSKTINLKVKTLISNLIDIEFTDEDLSKVHRLGTFPSFTLSFIDNLINRNIIPFENMIMISIKCSESNIQIKSLSLDNNDSIFTFDHGTKTIEKDLWAINLLSKTSIFNNNDVNAFKLIKFNLEIYATNDFVPTVNSAYPVLSYQQSFSLKFGPGKPYNLVLLDPLPPKELTDNEIIPFIKIGCVDRFNNRCAPKEYEIWEIKVNEDSIKTNSLTYQFNENGDILIEDAQLQLPLEIIDEINGENESFKQLFLMNSMIDNSEQNEQIEREIEVIYEYKLKRTNIPTKIEILHNNETIPNHWEVIAGTEITGLSFNILNESNERLLDWEDWFNKRNTGLEIDWKIETLPNNKKNKKNYSKVTNNLLPNIIIPNIIPKNTQTLDFSLEAFMKDDFNLEESFQITILPDKPVRYNIITSVNLSEGIMNNNHNDLISKIEKIVLIDQYKNNVPVTGYDTMPKLIVSWVQPEDDMDNDNMDMDMDMDMEENEDNDEENDENENEVSLLGK